MPSELKAGDVLFSMLSGSYLHKKIVRQQKRASETLRAQGKPYAGKDADTEDDKEKFDWSDENIVHAGVYSNHGEVVEVGASGVYHRQASARTNIDKVIRFDGLSHRANVGILAGKIPRLHFSYPTGDVGIFTLSSGTEAPLVKEPAALLGSDFLKAKADVWVKQKGYTTDALVEVLEQERENAWSRATIAKVLKKAGVKQEKGDKERLDPFICSHLVNAILYSALLNIPLIAALSMKEFRLNPAQMYRRFIFGQGIWATHKARDVGFNYMGSIYTDIMKR